MAITEQTFPISCRGGLDLSSNTQELLKKQGWATDLINFEPSVDGGYRRINGYTKIGEGELPEGGVNPISGIKLYNDGFVICKSSNVYYSKDGFTFVAINRAMDTVANPDGITYAQLITEPLMPRDTHNHYQFRLFRQGTKEILIGVDDGNKPFYVIIEGDTLETCTYLYKEINLTSGSLKGAKYCEKYKDQLVIAGMDSTSTEIYYSDILSPDDFEGANAGAIGFNDKVIGLKMFRENLYVFCLNSIHRVVGLESGSPARQPVTEQVGCVDGYSIQEVGGDLVFLAPDGLRTLSATQRIGDINISVLSSSINTRIRDIVKNSSSYNIRSEVLRTKSQYRIFLKAKPGANLPDYGFIMYLSYAGGNVDIQFSETRGFDISAIDTDYLNGIERTVSGSSTGGIYFHDEGSNFDGEEIYFLFQTPYFDMGDAAYRKNLHKIITYLKPEGQSRFNIQIKYDYDNQTAYQPLSYDSGQVEAPAVYRTSKYNVNEVQYGSTKNPVLSNLVEGSGKTVSLKIFPIGSACDPFSIQGFDVYYMVGGRI